MELTENESAALRRLAVRLSTLREFLGTHDMPPVTASSQSWFTYLAEIKAIQGNFNNDLSFVSCLLAKEYLMQRFEIAAFDVALKPQGASGLDIDEYTVTGERVIGEIKTTAPHHGVRFGAAQITSLRKDFVKLQRHQAEHKFMFVTDDLAFDAIKRGFSAELGGVTLVGLVSEVEHYCEVPLSQSLSEGKSSTS